MFVCVCDFRVCVILVLLFNLRVCVGEVRVLFCLSFLCVIVFCNITVFCVVCVELFWFICVLV